MAIWDGSRSGKRGNCTLLLASSTETDVSDVSNVSIPQHNVFLGQLALSVT